MTEGAGGLNADDEDSVAERSERLPSPERDAPPSGDRQSGRFGQKEGGDRDAPPATRRRRFGPRRAVLALIVVGGLIGAGVYWYLHRNLESTESAFIERNVITISPQIEGRVTAVHVRDNQFVKAGDVLFELDPEDWQIAVEDARARLREAQSLVAEARANLELTRADASAAVEAARASRALARASEEEARANVLVAEAELDRARADAARYQELARGDFASRQRLENALADARTAEARVTGAGSAVKVASAGIAEAEARLQAARAGLQKIDVAEAEVATAEANRDVAQASLRQAERNLSFTRIEAEHDGYVTRKSVSEGDVVNARQSLSALVYGDPWIVANFKETQLTRMRVGQPVDIRIDAYSDTVFKGRIDSMQRGTGARFSLLPPENATGNFVKVVQRVPVKIVFEDLPDDGRLLAPGMSTVPKIDVSATASDRDASQ